MYAGRILLETCMGLFATREGLLVIVSVKLLFLPFKFPLISLVCMETLFKNQELGVITDFNH